MKASLEKVNPFLKNQIASTFFQALADLKEVNEVETFLRDFMSEGEVEMFAKRLAAAYWLKKGRSYTNIRSNLKLSTATIAHMSSKLDSEGIRLGLKKIEAEEWASRWAEKIRKIVK